MIPGEQGYFMQELQALTERFPDMARKLYYIRTQEEGFQLLDANPVQLHYHRDHTARGYGSRDIVLKDRKRGISTWKILEGLNLMLFGPPGVGAAHVVHEAETAGRIFKILRWAYDRLPEEIRVNCPLNEDRRDAFEVNGSTAYAYTAGARGVARSETIHYAVLDEIAHWVAPEEATPGILDAVPRGGHVCQVSTPKGRDNYFYDACQAARRGDSDYKLYFYEWWWGAENALPLAPDERILPDEDEYRVIQLAQSHGFKLSDEQLKWRRNKLADPGTAKTFLQEHPEDVESCFLVSGSPLIDPNLLVKLVQEAEGARTMERQWLAGGGERIIWRHPIARYPYVVAVDVAEGKAHGDWSVISTWQLAPQALTNVSRTMLKCNTDDLAHMVVEEARKYHDALVVIERNSIGSNVVKKVADLGYYNQFQTLDRDREETPSFGWQTSSRSKNEMVTEFVDGVNAGDIVSYDAELWGQAMNVTKDEYGRPQTPKKRHDDIFMAACMAAIARDQARMRSGGGAIFASYA